MALQLEPLQFSVVGDFQKINDLIKKLQNIEATTKKPKVVDVEVKPQIKGKAADVLAERKRLQQEQERMESEVTQETETQVEKRISAYSRLMSFLYSDIGKTPKFKLFDSNSPIDSFVGKIGDIALKPFKSLASSIQGASEKLGQFFASLKRIAFYRLIRTVIKNISQGIQEGMKNLYAWSALVDNTFKKSMDSIATSALYAKNSLGAMIAPIMNSLAPAIEYLTDRFVELVNKINEFFASMRGQSTYTVAQRVATEWQAGADAVNKAVKEVKKSILGFDELNVLNGQNTSTTNTPQYTEMFKNTAISTEVKEFTTRVKTIFTEEGTPPNLEKIKDLGKDIAIKINAKIKGLDARKIGKQIADVINKGVALVVGFLREFDFWQAGRKVGEFLAEAIGNTDFKAIGEAIARLITGGIDFAIAFFTTPHLLGNIGTAMHDFLVSGFTTASAWLDEKDWVQVGADIMRSLKEFFANLKVEEIAESISSFLGKAIRAGIEILVGMTGEGAPNEAITPEWLFKKFLDLGEWVNKYIVLPFLNGLTDDEFKDDVEEAGGNVSLAFQRGIGNALYNLGTWIDENLWIPMGAEFGHIETKTYMKATNIGQRIIFGIGVYLHKIHTYLMDWMNPVSLFLRIKGITWWGLAKEAGGKLLSGLGNAFNAMDKWLTDHLWKPIDDEFKRVFPLMHALGEGLSKMFTGGLEVGLKEFFADFMQGFIQANKTVIDLIPGIEYSDVEASVNATAAMLRGQATAAQTPVSLAGKAQPTGDTNNYLKQINDTLNQINNKDMNVEVTTNSITDALTRASTRTGRVVAVGG